MIVCKSGVTTGRSCGELVNRDYTSNEPPDGETLYNQRKVTVGSIEEGETYGIGGGDSGGPAFESHTAYGIVVRRACGCDYFAYSHIENVEGYLSRDNPYWFKACTGGDSYSGC